MSFSKVKVHVEDLRQLDFGTIQNNIEIGALPTSFVGAIGTRKEEDRDSAQNGIQKFIGGIRPTIYGPPKVLVGNTRNINDTSYDFHDSSCTHLWRSQNVSRGNFLPNNATKLHFDMLQVDYIALNQQVRQVTLVKAIRNETVSYVVFENLNNSLLDDKPESVRLPSSNNTMLQLTNEIPNESTKVREFIGNGNLDHMGNYSIYITLIYLAVIVIATITTLYVMIITIIIFWMRRKMKKVMEDKSINVKNHSLELSVRDEQLKRMAKEIKELRKECAKKDRANEKLQRELTYDHWHEKTDQLKNAYEATIEDLDLALEDTMSL